MYLRFFYNDIYGYFSNAVSDNQYCSTKFVGTCCIFLIFFRGSFRNTYPAEK